MCPSYSGECTLICILALEDVRFCMFGGLWYLCTKGGCTVLYAFVRVRVLCTSGGCTVLYACVRVRVLCTGRGCEVLYTYIITGTGALVSE